jgi:hypothetical protein
LAPGLALIFHLLEEPSKATLRAEKDQPFVNLPALSDLHCATL